MIRRAILSIAGLYELLRLGFVAGFDLKNPYWHWRMHTAFGRGMPATRGEYYRSILHYGRWVHQQRMSRP